MTGRAGAAVPGRGKQQNRPGEGPLFAAPVIATTAKSDCTPRALATDPPGPPAGFTRTIARLQEFGFRPYLDSQGVLLIADTLPTQPGKKKRDASRFMAIATVFGEIVTGLADDPGLLDEEG
jgi:hypothetical protein